MTLSALIVPAERKTISSFSADVADVADGTEQAAQRMRGFISMGEKKAERRRCSASEAAMRKLSARMRTEQEIRVSSNGRHTMMKRSKLQSQSLLAMAI